MDKPASDTELTAIVIALEPDEVMAARARAANAMLRAGYPAGFPLDGGHPPHISIYAGFVFTADLPKVYAATGAVLANEPYTNWRLTAFGYHYIPLSPSPTGLAGILIQPTLGLIRMQQDMIDAAGPYTRKTATAEAFHTTAAEPDIHPAVIEYVTSFADHTGKNFNPHVSVGVGTKSFLDALLAEPFDGFTFSPASASVYQIGDYGAARRELKALPTA